jgi:hypothetical protein
MSKSSDDCWHRSLTLTLLQVLGHSLILFQELICNEDLDDVFEATEVHSADEHLVEVKNTGAEATAMSSSQPVPPSPATSVSSQTASQSTSTSAKALAECSIVRANFSSAEDYYHVVGTCFSRRKEAYIAKYTARHNGEASSTAEKANQPSSASDSDRCLSEKCVRV